METRLTPLEAEAALAAVERGRARVADEIGLPRWYWWGLALGWIAVGVVADLHDVWATSVAMLLFGAVHAAVAPRVATGRHRTDMLSVGEELAPARTARYVVLGVALLGLLTVIAGFVLAADGARHPATIASIFVAVLILLGGPRLLAALRPWDRAR
jgi:hypothetical protein